MILLVIDAQELITNGKYYYNDFMWSGRYAECIPVDEVIERMKNSKSGRYS